jgi:RNA polymerase sigma-70 factor (ECF subfamily)
MAAAGELYERHAPALFATALCVVRDRAEAEDVLHDAFVLILDRAPSYSESRGSPAGWMGCIVRNLGIDRARRQRRRARLDRAMAAAESRAANASPERDLDAAYAVRRFERGLMRLARVQRTVVKGAVIDERPYREIAQEEGVPLGTVKSRAIRALASLREAVGPFDVFGAA